ncbi:MAG: ATP-binding cassette domain-containing protein [Sphingobacteriia bacterium]|nr:ATP-binding cassette domain-containing protein [Sphingobacteriia bacterium]
MQIDLSSTGKRFNRDWIFRKLTYSFYSNNCYAITGSNGSGKSTLLQCIAGSTNISEGTIIYKEQDVIGSDDTYKSIVIAAPYLELVEEMTAFEFLQFHQTFKPFIKGMNANTALEEVGLKTAVHKQIRLFSSGMKQRLKLAQAFLADTAVLLLDEPCTNLDKEGIALYHSLIEKYANNRLVIVCSNDEQEIFFCKERVDIRDWK